MTEPENVVVWAPQPGPQQALVDCPLPLVGYGGARGGGKTDGVLGKFGILAETLGETFNGVFFRKELPQADDLIERAKQIYLPLEAHYNDQKKQFTFKGGGGSGSPRWGSVLFVFEPDVSPRKVSLVEVGNYKTN